jgi:ubiquinone/menaquinone biosynthesis C-methylase UbiE
MDLAKTRYRRILDLGTGSGVCIPSLLRISDFVLGLDYHEKLTEVRDLFGCAGYKGFALTRADGYKMPLKDKSVDLIIGVSVFEHLASNDSIVSECKRVLTDDGDLIVGIPVENFITRLRHIYYRPKYKFTNDHVIHSRDILKGIGRYFYIEESRKLLPLAPFELCFYYGARFKKRID